jgi:hypothetical protein
MDIVRPGEGSTKCIRVLGGSMRCTHNEVAGLEYCIWHMPDELLEEAEELTGWKRCRWHFGEPDACHFAAVRSTDPPRCKNHGANTGSVLAKRAAKAEVEGRVTDRAGELIAEKIGELMSPPPVGNPLTELMELAAEAKAWKEILRQVVAYLFDAQRIRSAHAKVGEQLRAEVLLYERAIDRLASLYIQISKLGIEAMLAGIDDTQAATIQLALDASLTAATEGLPDSLERQEWGRKVLQRELKKAAS